MFRYLFSVGCAVAACMCTATMVLAQTPSPANDRQRIATLKSIQTTVIRSVGAQDKSVEVTTTDNVLTVARVNSNMNNSTHSGRNNEAAAIASVVSKSITNNSALKNLNVIRVQYLVRGASAADGKILDTVEFRKNVTGKFQFHET